MLYLSCYGFYIKFKRDYYNKWNKEWKKINHSKKKFNSTQKKSTILSSKPSRIKYSKLMPKFKDFWTKNSTILTMFYSSMIQPPKKKSRNSSKTTPLFSILINAKIPEAKMHGMLLNRHIRHLWIHKKERFTFVSWEKPRKGLNLKERSKTKEESRLAKTHCLSQLSSNNIKNAV